MKSNVVIDERKRKFEKIRELYSSRKYRQEDIARELNIPLSIVRKVTEIAGYSHTKEITPDNANKGQGATMCVCYEDMDFLDKYDI